jgi:ligand-binding SRPBCC domain-containing protein
MPVFEYESYVDAPLDDVWEFHSRIVGLTELTPGWMRLTVEATTGPDGEPDPEILEEGSSVDVSLKPLGVFPRVSWRSVITERGREGDEAYFMDEMSDGPFKKWKHTHTFEARGDDRTLMRDRVEYALPLWMLGRAGSPFFRVNAYMMFRHRHNRTRELLGD